MTEKRVVILFVKLPEQGKVKSRLALRIGVDAAVRLYENMVFDMLDILEKGRFPFRICFTPPNARDQLAGWLGQDYDYLPQNGDNLGDRMEWAFARVYTGDVEEVLLIGSDIPGLTTDVIDEAFTALLTNDAVIGPADDGGYYLIGFRKKSFEPGIFRDMVWSTGTVFRATIDKLQHALLKVHVLPELTDVDTVDDLRTLMSQAASPALENSRTLSFLEQHCKDILRSL